MSELSDETACVRMLRAVRLQNHWSQRDLAQQLNVSRWTVNRWENGREPPVYLMAALRELLAHSVATASLSRSV